MRHRLMHRRRGSLRFPAEQRRQRHGPKAAAALPEKIAPRQTARALRQGKMKG